MIIHNVDAFTGINICEVMKQNGGRIDNPGRRAYTVSAVMDAWDKVLVHIVCIREDRMIHTNPPDHIIPQL